MRARATLAVLLLGGAMTAGCSRRLDDGPVGTAFGIVRVAVSLLAGLTLSSMKWQVMSAGNTLIKQGDIDTSDPHATISFDTTCPLGSGDTVLLTATGMDGLSCSGTSESFNVTADAPVLVAIQLACGRSPPPEPGIVHIPGRVVPGDNCPLLVSFKASPQQSTSGVQLIVSVAATDADVAETLTYTWSAPTGSFSDPSAATTTYVCGDGYSGLTNLTVSVSDSHDPPCTTSTAFQVDCTPSTACPIDAGSPCP